jgi:hypothetical protein
MWLSGSYLTQIVDARTGGCSAQKKLCRAMKRFVRICHYSNVTSSSITNRQFYWVSPAIRFDERGIPREVLHHRGEGWRFRRLEPAVFGSVAFGSFSVEGQDPFEPPLVLTAAIGLYDSESLCGGISQFPAIRL